MRRRVAAIDCGTNSIRLLVAEAGSDNGLHEISRHMQIVRLGQDVDRTARLSAAALARTERALAEYAAIVAAADVDAVRMVATSATRDATNAREFARMAERILGVRPEVLSGPAEALLSFRGAMHGLDRRGRGGPVVVVDIGGGSTEIVRGDRTAVSVDVGVSLDIGSVRLTERHIRDDPPGPDQIAAVEDDVGRALDRVREELAAGVADLGGPGTDRARADLARADRARADRARADFSGADLVGVAGTVTTVAAVALGLPRYDSRRIHGAVVTRAQVDAAVAALVAMNRAERAACPVVHPGRVDVIVAGAIIMRSVVHHLGADRILVSEHDILDGVALSLL